ncbi:MAG: 30S ribosomal protein S15 [Candidatus Nanohaloarchaea archaeon]|nr:30S ribosomal protein S15 [Candidatus Nanohaloarchaea archaeon]
MARMHSARRGSSGSTKPRNPDTSWVVYDEDEIRQLVEKLADQGFRASEIGRKLRDRYGVPDVKEITGQSITDILEEQDKAREIPEDLYNLMEKAVAINDHLQEHGKDDEARRNLNLTESKIRRLADYYRGDELPEDWSYSLDEARLRVE